MHTTGRVRHLCFLATSLVIWASGLAPLRAAESPVAALAGFRYGQPADLLNAVEAEVRRAQADPAWRAAVERDLVAVLDSSVAPEARQFACVQLRVIGTARAVPALARALADAELAPAATATLEALTEPTAGDALRAALATASGRTLLGVINALGRRAEPASTAALVRLLERPEPDMVAAAVLALGHIADDAALDALRAVAVHFDERAGEGGGGPGLVVKLAGPVKVSLAPVLADAFLVCADKLRAAGQTATAALIFERLHGAAAAPEASRVAALRGWVVSDPDRAAARVFELLVSGRDGWDLIAQGLLRELPASAVAETLAPRLDSLPPVRQAAVLTVLAERPVAPTSQLLLAASSHAEPAVRLAALNGLGNLEATGPVARSLITAAAGRTGAEQQAARASLARARGAALDAVLLAGLQTGQPAERAECARALATRGVRRAVPALLAAAQEAEPVVRAAAFQALAGLAEAAEYPALLRLLLTAATAADRAAAVKTVLAAASQLPDSASRTRPLTDAFADASRETRLALLACLGQLGGPEALAAVRAAVRDPDEAVRGEAAATLAGWPDASPLPDLLELAATASPPAHRIVALRGVVAVADQATNLPPARLLEVYRRALAAAARPEEKRLVLAGAARLNDPAALDLVEPLLADAALRDDAALAAAQLGRRLAESDPARARAAIDRARATSTNPAVQAVARETLDLLERDQDFVRTWLLAGPFTTSGSGRLIDTAFPPETDAPTKWKPVRAGQGIVDLGGLLGGDQRAAYLRAVVHSPRAQRVQLQLGSDDGLKVWLNGQVVHRADVDRGLVPGQDQVEVELREGRNTLLLKVVQFAGGWAACCRIRGLDGASVPGLTVTAE